MRNNNTSRSFRHMVKRGDLSTTSTHSYIVMRHRGNIHGYHGNRSSDLTNSFRFVITVIDLVYHAIFIQFGAFFNFGCYGYLVAMATVGQIKNIPSYS